MAEAAGLWFTVQY